MIAVMRRDSRAGTPRNWWAAGAFVAAGTLLLAVAAHSSPYWQSVLINFGTTLFLFALLAFFEPLLIRHLREPRTLDEALARFAPLVAPFARGPGSAPSTDGSGAEPERIKDHVLRVVARTGLHQHSPALCSARFTNLGGPAVDWRVEWDGQGIRHRIQAGGRKVPTDLQSSIEWREKVTAHEDRIYKIVCHLLRELDPSGRR